MTPPTCGIGCAATSFSAGSADAAAGPMLPSAVDDPAERARIRQIENGEWLHRERVGELLTSLGAAPDRRRERRAAAIGRTLGFLCHVAGWFVPMYGAGRLESRNIRRQAN